MRGRNKKRWSHLFFNQIFLAILGFLILIAISIPLAKNVSRRYRVSKEVKELAREIEELEKRNSELKNLVNYLQSDQFVEEQARLNLNYKKEGEKMVVIKDKSENATSAAILDKESLRFKSIQADFSYSPNSNPGRWRRYFFR